MGSFLVENKREVDTSLSVVGFSLWCLADTLSHLCWTVLEACKRVWLWGGTWKHGEHGGANMMELEWHGGSCCYTRVYRIQVVVETMEPWIERGLFPYQACGIVAHTVHVRYRYCSSHGCGSSP